MQLSTRHLLGIKDLNPEDISLILSTAAQFKEVLQRLERKSSFLREVTIVNLFMRIPPVPGSLLSWRRKD